MCILNIVVSVRFPFLVLDEADRILDMGFADTMNAIIENLPKKRQTLLFSATQTKSVKDLARLSLKNPEYVWVHEKAKYRYVLLEIIFDSIKIVVLFLD